MERKKVMIEMTVLTTRQREREIDLDLCRLCPAIRGLESGETQIEEVEIKEIV